MKKSYLIIGMSKLGRYLAIGLANEGCDVMIVDEDENNVYDIANAVANAQIGDCTDENVMDTIGISDFDACFVCMGDDFSKTLEITYLLSKKNANRIITIAKRDRYKEILMKNGADEVIYIEQELGKQLSKIYSKSEVRNYIEIDKGVPICEIETPNAWVGKKVIDLDLRNKYEVNIIGVRSEKTNKVSAVVSPEYVFKKGNNIILVGDEEKIDSFFEKVLS